MLIFLSVVSVLETATGHHLATPPLLPPKLDTTNTNSKPFPPPIPNQALPNSVPPVHPTPKLDTHVNAASVGTTWKKMSRRVPGLWYYKDKDV